MAGFDALTPGVLPGQSRAEQTSLADSPQQAKVLTVTSKGATVELTRMPGVELGPAAWGLGSYATVTAAITAGYAPHVGDACVVVFAGRDLQHPWVLAWTR